MAVWEHLLLQLGAAGIVFLPAVSGKCIIIQGPTEKEGKPPDLPGRSFPQYCYSEEESWSYSTKEVHIKVAKRER